MNKAIIIVMFFVSCSPEPLKVEPLAKCIDSCINNKLQLSKMVDFNAVKEYCVAYWDNKKCCEYGIECNIKSLE